ncbi:unnamed protein product, partial [Rotaria sordida]
MASSNRRASHDLGFTRTTNTTNRRTSSIDNDVTNSTIFNSRRLSMDTSISTSHLQATVIAQGPSVAFFG